MSEATTFTSSAIVTESVRHGSPVTVEIIDGAGIPVFQGHSIGILTSRP